MRKSAFLIAAASFCFAGSAFAVDVKKMVDVPASPDSVWKTIGDFCGIANWHPAIEKCEISKKDGVTFRTLTLKGGGAILEKQTAWDNKSEILQLHDRGKPAAGGQLQGDALRHAKGKRLRDHMDQQFQRERRGRREGVIDNRRHFRCRAHRHRSKGEVSEGCFRLCLLNAEL